MRKNLPIIITIIILILLSFSYVKYTQNKYRDITFTVEKQMTSGLFNSHKMYSISNIQLAFSDSNVAVVNVSGLQNKVPHKNVAYKVFLEKKNNGTWKILRIYPLS